MEGLLRQAFDAAQRAVAAPALLLLLGVMFVYVMTYNYRRFRREAWVPQMLEGETLVDRLDVLGSLVTTKTLLTNRRVVHLRHSWLFSSRRQLAIAFEDIHSVVSRRRSRRWAFAMAALLLGVVNPAALLLFLWALEAKVYSILFDTSFSQMPRTRIRVRASRRDQLSNFDRFYRNALAIWARVRSERALAAPDLRAEAVEDSDFSWGKPVWLYLGLFLALGVGQRLTQPHLSYDDLVFAPIFIALPVAVGLRSLRDGLWLAALGPVILLTVKFPSVALSRMLASDGGVPRLFEYAFLIGTMMLAVTAAARLARRAPSWVACLATIVWVGFEMIVAPDTIISLALLAKVALATAWAMAFVRLERTFGSRYGAAHRGAMAPAGS